MTGNLSDMSPANGGQTGGEGWGERRSGAGGEGMTISAFDQVDDSQRQHEIQDGGGVDHFMRVASSDTPPGLARTLGGSKNGGTGAGRRVLFIFERASIEFFLSIKQSLSIKSQVR